jgi:hypothetical protein
VTTAELISPPVMWKMVALISGGNRYPWLAGLVIGLLCQPQPQRDNTVTAVSSGEGLDRPLAVQAFSAARVRATSALSRSPLPLRLNTLVARNWARHAGLTLK